MPIRVTNLLRQPNRPTPDVHQQIGDKNDFTSCLSKVLVYFPHSCVPWTFLRPYCLWSVCRSTG